jgi:hypothetical protein
MTASFHILSNSLVTAYPIIQRSQNSIASIVTRLWAGQNPAGARNFCLLQNFHTGSGAHPASYIIGTGGSLPVVKWPWCEADHSSQSSAEVKNECSCTSTPPMCLHDVYFSMLPFNSIQYMVLTVSLSK